MADNPTPHPLKQAWLARAFSEGRDVAMTHKTADTTGCPYRPRSDMQEEWFRGYKEGRRCL